MQKLKYKQSKEMYRLYLNKTEAELVAFLVRHVRLGEDDKYKDAAFSLIQTFNESFEFDFSNLDECISLSVNNTKSEGLVFEISEIPPNDPNEYPDNKCCGKCSGACNKTSNNIRLNVVGGSLLPTSKEVEQFLRSTEGLGL